MLFVVSLLAFNLVLLVPGSPAVTLAGDNPSQEQIDAIEESLGLDDPTIVQYGRWLGGALHGDLGSSLRSGQDVAGEIWARLPVTLSLTLAAVIVGLAIAVPCGVLAALRPRSALDRVLTVGSTLGVAAPSFLVGILLVVGIALRFDWFPATGYVGPTESVGGWIRHLTLPALALGVAVGAELTRQIRSSLLQVLQSDYVRTARAKGLPGHLVIGKHAAKNAAIPVLTILGAQVAVLLGGTVIIEQIFALPGLGSLAIRSVTSQDLPLIQGIVVVSAVVVLIVNTLVDVSYTFLDPRIRDA